MENILKIYKRLNNSYVKQRILLVYLIAQNTILSLAMLIFANVIISNGQINGELDYSQIRYFYTFAIIALFVLVLIFAPIFLSRTLNTLYKKNIIEHLLSAKVELSEIVYAVFLRGTSILIILLVSSFPIIVISFYFGGFGIIKMLKLVGIIISYAVFFSSICLYISTKSIDENASTIISYVIGIILTLLNIYYLNYFLNSRFLIVFYVLFNIIMSLILLSLSKKTSIFNA
ncbi:MAG: hypothetical protein J6P02_05170 [Lachnospiraceae bacterium]|nr:hypothetical protein [Lachnospiraceae bacterium]